ncbi:acetyl-CoA C-acetyltransferase [Tsukamurella ocularis]|uniref:acetyl-CoA C-acetyltransferase n=1 Tax=Tsukamurella ocularis TaxID=1970234 RepID=UPI0021675923|nr:acetyl-CoA C-acetyltransferase [Tsukamurella ocularis]MCS3778912.1 acetyl-CoA C-acetyltransferase [Tsukamurella ocularis]MCS3787468.1 acetyl-CoA C-acetyltransferase [Tsukamurella ocularis]MCS3851595.1 acetyl-CoA C-acetyltransferase [Tsukamurella ocularis]
MTDLAPGAYILDAVRTPSGKRGGSLSTVHSADLGAHVLRASVLRSGVDPELVDDVIMGCCDTIGPQSGNIARTSWLAAGLPEQVPGVTVDRQCGSSQQSVHFAAQAVLSGTADAVVAAGVQNMSAVPISAAMLAGREYGFDDPFSGSVGWRERYGDVEVSQFTSADMIAAKWGVSRTRMEEFALASHERAIAATDEGRFEAEIAPVEDFAIDETPRRGTTLEKMAGLAPLAEGSAITAAVASQIADGAAAVMVASADFVQRHGLRPRARIHHISVRAADPVWMLTGPIPATRYALQKTGLTIGDIDLFECNEAFASVPLAWMDELGIPHDKVNVNGGGIALGHPLGATGAKLMTTLLHELERRDARYGLQTMCEGGGTANVTIIERI